MAAAPKLPFWKKKRNSPEDPEEFRLTLVEHLEELRNRIIRCLVLVVIGWTAGWFLEPPLYGYLHTMIHRTVGPIAARKGFDFREVFSSATEAFTLKFKLSLIIGLILVFPLLILQLWGFIEPALKPHERKPFRLAAPISVILFLIGAGCGWFIIPSAIGWFTTYIEEFPGTSLYQNVPDLIFFSMKIMLAFGLGFQLPLVVYALNSLGFLETETLMKHWRKATFAVFMFAMIVTPSNDMFTMLSMAVPVSVLFLITIVVVKIADRRRKRRAPAEDVE